MTRGFGFGVLLICLVRAELVCCSRAKNAVRPPKSNKHAGFPLRDSRLVKFSSNLQNHLKRGFSPRSVQTSRFISDPAVIQMGFADMGRKETFPTQQVTGRSLRESFFRPAYQSAAQEPSSYRRMSSSATLFGPVAAVAPGPRSSVQMQTYAQAPARKIVPGRTSGGAKPRSFSPQTAAGMSNLSPEFALNVGGYRPRSQLLLSRLAVTRSSRVGESAPGYAPVMIHEIPEPFGGSAIRRLKRPTEQEKVPFQKPQQISTHPWWVAPYNPYQTSIRPGSDWTRIKQNQGPVQKPQQVATPPPRRVPAYNPDLPSIHPVSTWTKVKLSSRL
ncbi:hypothetical protein ATANTOWER_014971 [Ataeniobius toweri]|uniref:Uncharacterized protein n=1 Tax=Ataeniobius toweri TaxID=208326 RepID=A0ABU7CGN8_9TELE|nr:hypothetical protein [Ataeniobius toweri]